VPVLGNHERGEPRSTVVLDNASVHHVEGIVEAIEDAGAVTICTAPCSPECSPIETMFHLHKSQLRRHQDKSWIDAHALALKNVTPAKARASLRHALVPGCEHFEDELSAQEEEEEFLAVAALVALLARLTHNAHCSLMFGLQLRRPWHQM